MKGEAKSYLNLELKLNWNGDNGLGAKSTRFWCKSTRWCRASGFTGETYAIIMNIKCTVTITITIITLDVISMVSGNSCFTNFLSLLL